MDITRLPVSPLSRPASASQTGVRQPASVDEAARADAARPHTREPRGRIVEGELLRRQPAFYQSTRSFIDERNLDQARPAEQPVASPRQTRLAVSRYISNVRPEPVAELTQGRSVNFFV
jgi:hypothetical protein